jgi:hypothetical protein
MNLILSIITSIISAFSLLQPVEPVSVLSQSLPEVKQVLASQEYSLQNRYHIESVNEIFADNILLALLYLDGDVKKGDSIDWETVRKPDSAVFTLKPGESFAFHDNLTADRADSVVQTTNARFIANEGFRNSGFIVGDGVCHLASFIKVVSAQAGLEVYAPVRHDFAVIPDVSRDDATSINSGDTRQNMYITNITSEDIQFIFEHSAESITMTIETA